MTTASELITRSLRLLNQPGRGAKLAAEDTNNAFAALREILNSEATSKQFVPGIRRHYFNLQSDKAIYTYGASPQLDFRSDDFGIDPSQGDPAPIHIEAAYVRGGSTITNNEVVEEYRFENLGAWVLAGGAVIANNFLTIEQFIATADLALNTGAAASVDLTGSTTYTLRTNLQVNNGTVQIELLNNAVVFDTYVLDSSGKYSFDFVWPAGTLPSIRVSTLLATDDVKFTDLSILERGLERVTVPDSQGSDYRITLIDQTRYNRRFTKGTGGRPYAILYTRSFSGIAGNGVGQGEIRFDNAGIAGDILVMDVLVNKVSINTINDTLRISEAGEKWLRYALADDLSGEYGKTLNTRQISIMDAAWDQLAASNRRNNMLGVDRALRERPTYDINRGDP